MELTPCCEHTYKGNPQGYARVSRQGKKWLLHRLVYCATHGLDILELSPCQVVRHTCDNTRCINPHHLVIGSQADNVRDMMERKRHIALRGEAHGSTRYSDQDIAAVRRMYIPYVCGIRTVARALGLSKSHVHNIITNANRSLREQDKP